jgi:hypothetical protein
MGSIRRLGVPIAAVVAGALVLPAGALGAVTKPGVTTGGATDIKPTTVTLHGSVDPNGAATTYFFQVGPNRLYGGVTTTTNAGNGTKGVRIKSSGSGFIPATTYHYRLVAHNRKGYTFGKDRTFKSKKQPLALTLGATPNPVRSGHATTLSGVLSGTGHANKQIKLEKSAWPFTTWVQDGNPQVTGSTGAFSFPILSVPANTQYRVSLVSNPTTVSPALLVGTTVKVTRHAKVFPGTKRGRIHFWGRLTPAADGAAVQIQKLRQGNWITIGQTLAKASGKGYSRYTKRIKQKHGGRYRVVAIDISGVHSVSVSRSIRRHHLRG